MDNEMMENYNNFMAAAIEFENAQTQINNHYKNMFEIVLELSRLQSAEIQALKAEVEELKRLSSN